MSDSFQHLLLLQHKERLTDASCDDVVVKLTFAPKSEQCLPSFVAGQYVKLRLPSYPELSDAYFALASDPNDTATYEFVIKGVHPLSEVLVDLVVGQDVETTSPMGKGFDLAQYKGKNVILMGVGTGIAPLRSLWHDMILHREDYGSITIYAGFLSSMHHLLNDEMDDLAKHDVKVSISLASGHDDWGGSVGYVQHALEEDKPSPENTVVCLAGMNVMVDACTQSLLALGFNEQQILLNF